MVLSAIAIPSSQQLASCEDWVDYLVYVDHGNGQLEQVETQACSASQAIEQVQEQLNVSV